MLVCGDVSLGFVVRVAGHPMIHYFYPLLLLARLPNICEYADDHGALVCWACGGDGHQYQALGSSSFVSGLRWAVERHGYL